MTKKELEESREQIFRAYQVLRDQVVTYESVIKEISLYAEDNMDKADKVMIMKILESLRLRLALSKC